MRAEAAQVSVSIVDGWEKAEALTALATSFVLAEQWEEAQDAWAEAERVRKPPPSDEMREGEASKELAIALIRQQRWAEAEQLIRSSDNLSEQLLELARVLAQQHHWEDAERVSALMPYSLFFEGTLTNLASELAAQGEDERQLRLVQRWWQRATYRQEAIAYLPLAYGLLPRCPELALAFSEAFTWVDTFLEAS